MTLQFTPPKPLQMSSLLPQAQPQTPTGALPLPFPDAGLPDGVNAAPAQPSAAPAIPQGPQGPTPQAPAAPPESAQLSSRLQALSQPPSTKESLLKAVLAFAPTAVAGAVGGLPAAAGAAQGASTELNREAAVKQQEKQSLIEQVHAARQMEQQNTQFGLTDLRDRQLAADKLAQESQTSQTLEAGRNTRAGATLKSAQELKQAEIAAANQRNQASITARGPGALTPEGIKATEGLKQFENSLPGKETPPMSPGLYNQRKGLAQIVADNAAAKEASKAGNDERLAGVPTAMHAKVYADVQKAEDAHTKAQAASDTINTFIDQARKGNKEAYAYSPVAGVLEINTGAGISRINRQEIDAYGGAGSIFDRIQAAVGKQATGASISPAVLNDMQALHRELGGNTDKTYQRSLESIDRTYRSKFAGSGGAPSASGGETTVTFPDGSKHTYGKDGKLIR